MIVTIAKQFTFDAAHYLPGLPTGHKCGGMHGHTYGVELQLGGDTGDREVTVRDYHFPAPFLIDYADIANIWLPLHVALDHKILNDVPGLEFPSTERLVGWCVERLHHAFRAHTAVDFLKVRVSESASTWAESPRVSISERALALYGQYL